MPCLKPKDSKVIESAARRALLDALVDDLAQLVHAHARGVDDQVRGVDDGLEQLALHGDGLAQVEIVAAHRMLAAGLGEAAQQLLLARDQEQHFAVDAAALQLIDELRHGGDFRGGIARIEPDGGALVGGFGAAHGVRDERLQQRGGNVVDAVEAEVLEHVQGHALAGTRQAADDDDAHASDVSDAA